MTALAREVLSQTYAGSPPSACRAAERSARGAAAEETSDADAVRGHLDNRRCVGLASLTRREDEKEVLRGRNSP